MKNRKLKFSPLKMMVFNRASKRFLTGFTLVEILTVVAIIATLVAILIPALSTVQRIAKETKQKAQFNSIKLALETFKNDFGDYPPSNYLIGGNYCGAQKLAEALVGWDLLGFHPKSAWRADGLDTAGGAGTYDPGRVRDTNGDGFPDTLEERQEPYLQLADIGVFRLGNISIDKPGLFNNTGNLHSDTYVICDVFGVKKVTMVKSDPVTGQPISLTENAGTPILYYKANTSSKRLLNNLAEFDNNIYNMRDNGVLVNLGKITDRKEHPLYYPELFYSAGKGIVDPKVVIDPGDPTKLWPYRPDSYILISAGADGLYGTSDDIRNFGN